MAGQRRAYFVAAALAPTGVVASLSRGRRAPAGQAGGATPAPAPARDAAD